MLLPGLEEDRRVLRPPAQRRGHGVPDRRGAPGQPQPAPQPEPQRRTRGGGPGQDPAGDNVAPGVTAGVLLRGAHLVPWGEGGDTDVDNTRGH